MFAACARYVSAPPPLPVLVAPAAGVRL